MGQYFQEEVDIESLGDVDDYRLSPAECISQSKYFQIVIFFSTLSKAALQAI